MFRLGRKDFLRRPSIIKNRGGSQTKWEKVTKRLAEPREASRRGVRRPEFSSDLVGRPADD